MVRTDLCHQCQPWRGVDTSGSRQAPRLAAFSFAPRWASRCGWFAIEGCCHEDRPSGRWPAIYCCWAFLVRATGLLQGSHNAAMIDYGAGIVALGICLVWFGWR